MNPVAITLRPVPGGWAVLLTDGRELARFRGLGARYRALRFLNTALGDGYRSARSDAYRASRA